MHNLEDFLSVRVLVEISNCIIVRKLLVKTKTYNTLLLSYIYIYPFVYRYVFFLIIYGLEIALPGYSKIYFFKLPFLNYVRNTSSGLQC